MKIIISGGGKVGEKLCIDLSHEGHDVVLIDRNFRRLEEVIDLADITGIVGNGALLESQIKAGIESADIFMAVSPDDENNLIAGVVAKRAGAKFTIIRVRDPEYSKQLGFLRRSLGIDMMINPEQVAANEIVNMIRFPSSHEILVLNQGRTVMVGVGIEKGCQLDGLVLKDLDRINVDVLACIIKRNGEIFIPHGENIIKGGDIVYFIGAGSELFSLYRKAGSMVNDIKTVMIIGGGRHGEYLIKNLIELGIRVKVIEVNAARAEYLASEYTKAEIVLGDGTNQQFLRSQRIGNYDCVISLTNIDEENLLLSIFAHQSKVKKTITKVNRTDLLKILPPNGLESIIRPRQIIADRIVRIVRSIQNTEGSAMTNLYRPADGKVEVMQFLIAENSKVIGVPLSELKIKSGIMVSLIVRDGVVIYPRGNSEIEEHDFVMVVTKIKGLNDINDILVTQKTQTAKSALKVENES